MAKTVVILGGSFAGLKIAHLLLQKTLPVVKGLKVIVVSKSTHMYWNLAAPRAIVPGQIPDEKVFQPIKPAFAKYSSSNFEFVLGEATSVDPDVKKVEISTAEGARELEYDVLVVTTGSSAVGGSPWKQGNSYEESLAALHETQEKVKKAKSIVLGGGGVTGVETAGELGFEYGKEKQITLVSKDDGILKGFLGDKVANNALNELKKNHVNIIVKATVDAAKTLESGQTELTLSNGTKIVTDCYIPCVGLSPNSSFMPKTLLSPQGEIKVDEYMQVKGVKDIWSCGDVADIQANKVFFVAAQAPLCAANIQASLTSKPKTAYKPNNKPIGAVTVGRAKGFGAFGSWSLPSFLIYHMKVKSMMVENLAKALAGTM